MNLLLIHSDQHRFDCIRAHGLRGGLQTPNLDRLCAEGTCFARAYSTIPICTPARASLLTGAWPQQHGAFCIPSSELDRAARRQLPTFFQQLKQCGYRTGWVGKYHQELEAAQPGPADGVDAFHPLWHYDRQREADGLSKVARPHGLFGDEDPVTPPHQSALAWQADRIIAKTSRPHLIQC